MTKKHLHESIVSQVS